MTQQAHSYHLAKLTGEDIDAIMTGLAELPAKHSRALMNKIEAQIIEQLKAEQKNAAEAATEDSK